MAAAGGSDERQRAGSGALPHPASPIASRARLALSVRRVAALPVRVDPPQPIPRLPAHRQLRAARREQLSRLAAVRLPPARCPLCRRLRLLHPGGPPGGATRRRHVPRRQLPVLREEGPEVCDKGG